VRFSLSVFELPSRISKVLITAALISCSILLLLSFTAGAALADNISDLNSLGKASSVYYYSQGKPTAGELWLAFKRLKNASPAQVNAAVIKARFTNATSAGKIYLFLLMRQVDPVAASHLMDKLITNKSKVVYRKPYASETITVEKLARRIAAGLDVLQADSP